MPKQSTPVRPSVEPRIEASRELEQIVIGRPTSDGAGVKLTRVLTQNLQKRLDPFLMLDEFGSDQAGDYIAGFPDHPHRGFETVTYMLNGRMRHRDSVGNSGLLTNGGVQWMTAGRGIIHSEMPEQEDGLMRGFQLWVNLPAKNKLMAPGYQDLPSEAIPEVLLANGALVRVIAGAFAGITGAIQRPDTEPLYLDVHIPAGASVQLPIQDGHNAFLYPYEGELTVGALARLVKRQQMGILSSTAGASGITVNAVADSRFILVAGKPLREAIAQYGPFVMNTPEEIEQAIRDYQSGRLAF
ncbi:MAG: pirin family protein [Permianibacter sp.]